MFMYIALSRAGPFGPSPLALLREYLAAGLADRQLRYLDLITPQGRIIFLYMRILYLQYAHDMI